MLLRSIRSLRCSRLQRPMWKCQLLKVYKLLDFWDDDLGKHLTSKYKQKDALTTTVSLTFKNILLCQLILLMLYPRFLSLMLFLLEGQIHRLLFEMNQTNVFQRIYKWKVQKTILFFYLYFTWVCVSWKPEGILTK